MKSSLSKTAVIILATLLLLFGSTDSYCFTPQLSLGSVTGFAGSQVSVPVTLATNGAPVIAISIDIGFDPTKLSVPLNAAGTAPLAASRGPAISITDEYGDPIKNIAQSLPSPGLLRLGIFGTNTIAIGDGVVALVKFNLAESATGLLVLTNISSSTVPGGTATAGDGSINATLPPPPSDGVCGAANGTTVTTKPAANLCGDSSLPAVTGDGPWSWRCAGLYGGDPSPTCTANIQTFTLSFLTDSNGTLLGTTNQSVSYGFPATAVTALPAAGYHFVNWTGSDGFLATTDNPLTVSNVTRTQSIIANFAHDPVSGACGSSNGKWFYSVPAVNLCAVGTVDSLAGKGPWTWNCAGQYDGTTASCSAVKPGDCDISGTITIAEVQNAINMFLGLNPLLSCVDMDASSTVSIAEVQTVINGFLSI